MTATSIEKYALHRLPAPKVIASDAQRERYVSALLELQRRKHLTSRARSYAELLTLLIEAYEEEHYPIRGASSVEVLRGLVTANKLRQKDLISEVGSESIVSEILSWQARTQ
jgi:HTH-type transcriptional regulator/antitoxin HigA